MPQDEDWLIFLALGVEPLQGLGQLLLRGLGLVVQVVCRVEDQVLALRFCAAPVESHVLPQARAVLYVLLEVPWKHRDCCVPPLWRQDIAFFNLLCKSRDGPISKSMCQRGVLWWARRNIETSLKELCTE